VRKNNFSQWRPLTHPNERVAWSVVDDSTPSILISDSNTKVATTKLHWEKCRGMFELTIRTRSSSLEHFTFIWRHGKLIPKGKNLYTATAHKIFIRFEWTWKKLIIDVIDRCMLNSWWKSFLFFLINKWINIEIDKLSILSIMRLWGSAKFNFYDQI
jgi:hypothetical protein